MYSVEHTLVEIVRRDSKRTKLTIPAEGPARLKLRVEDEQFDHLLLEFAAKLVLAVSPNKSTMRMTLMIYNGEPRVMNKSVTAHEDDIKKLVEIDAFGQAKIADVENAEPQTVETPVAMQKCDCNSKKSWRDHDLFIIVQNVMIATGLAAWGKYIVLHSGIENALLANLLLLLFIAPIYLLCVRYKKTK